MIAAPKNHARDVLMFVAGVVLGTIAVLAEQTYGFGLAVAFIAGPVWLLGRFVAAWRFLRRLRDIANKHSLEWNEPKIRDGRLVWLVETGMCDGDGDQFVAVSSVEPSRVSDDECVRLIRSMAGNGDQAPDGRAG